MVDRTLFVEKQQPPRFVLRIVVAPVKKSIRESNGFHVSPWFSIGEGHFIEASTWEEWSGVVGCEGSDVLPT